MVGAKPMNPVGEGEVLTPRLLGFQGLVPTPSAALRHLEHFMPTTVGPSASGTLPLTTRVEEALPRAHLRVLLCQTPLRPAEALCGEEQAAATLDELLEQLRGAASQNHIIAR